MKFEYMMETEKILPYYQFPKFLLELPLSQNAKILYMLLYDRARISQKNHWLNEDGYVYFVFPITEISLKWGKCCTSVKAAMKELDEYGLLIRSSGGFSKPNHLYMRIPCIELISEPDVKQTDENKTSIGMKSCPSFSRKTASSMVGIVPPSKVKEKYNNNPELAIIDENQQVHMARIDMHYGFSVNGVAALHTEILKNSELKPFYDIYPNKFNNKTNGITFRRWLLHSNHELTGLISSKIGDGFKKDANELEKLMQFKDDEAVLKAITDIKMTKKKEFKDYLLKKENIEIDENSIIDVQVKRLHEYKRQQMNALYIIHKYMDIKAGNKPARPITFVFGAKAAPAYTIAKDIIHLILCLSKVIENDPEVSPYLKVVMLENYNVTYAEKIIPAADISEQISLASKEASGTSNMKFMLNGAVTLGTEDGANVEIHELVGDDNIYIFGEKSDTVIEHYAKADYSAEKIYDEDPEIAKLVDFIIDKKMFAVGNKKSLIRLYMEIVTKDWFMTLLDIKDYIRVKEQVFKDYEDRAAWSRKMIKNIAMAGFFSSDRTIAQYNDDIWHLD